MSSLGARFRAARQHNKMSQDKIADSAGISQYIISKIENGQVLQPRQIDHFAKILNVTPEFLLYGANPPSWFFLEKEKTYIEQYLVNFYKGYDLIELLKNDAYDKILDRSHKDKIICPCPTLKTVALEIEQGAVIFSELLQSAEPSDTVIAALSDRLVLTKFSDIESGYKIVGIVISTYKKDAASRIQRYHI